MIRGRHIVWDWNGTLLDDATLLIGAVNCALAVAGGKPITLGEHRLRYERPMRFYYERRVGRALTDDEFSAMCTAFDRAYEAAVPTCALTVGAVDCLRSWPATQSLLSLADPDHLEREVDRRGLRSQFTRIDARPLGARVGKAELLSKHLSSQELAASSVVLIGDSPDDYAAARAVGAPCILYAGGYYAASRLRTTGAPVVSSLVEAVHLVVHT
jgi:phosphoglycolate phosphatase-like HAD superfamily hydrolase